MTAHRPFQEVPLSDSIAARFARQVAAAPDHLAIVTEDVSLTYAELDAAATHIAACIPQIAESKPVALLLPEGHSLYAAMLGAAKAARAFIVLETSSPEARLARVIADSGSDCVVSDRSTCAMAEIVAGSAARAINIDDRSSRGVFVPPSAPAPNATAYIIYTSGSTGRPKGVAISNRASNHRLDTRKTMHGVVASDHIAHVCPSGFSVGLNTVLITLLAGACLYPFDIQARGLGQFTAWMRDREITNLVMTSSLFRTWLASLRDSDRFPALRMIQVNAEALLGADVTRLGQHLSGDWQLANVFGTTETSVTTYMMFGPSSVVEAGVLPVGQPATDLEIAIEDDDGNAVGDEEVGQVVVKGRYIADGYWNDPLLTAQFFRIDAGSDTRTYLTGDLGRWRRDGQLELVGRKSRKVKLRGHSVELSEVESALLGVSHVSAAAATLVADGTDEARLVAYVSISDGGSRNGQYIRAIVTAQLPSIMVPSQVVVLDALPFTARGKIDYAALPPAPPLTGPYAPPSRAPSNVTESLLLQIWQEVLNLPNIGIDDDFYDLGGTSLQAFLIFAQTAQKLGRDLPPTAMHTASTIAKQAALLQNGPQRANGSKLIAFREHGTRKPLFLIHALFGDIAFARELARHMKSDRAIYGFEPPPLDGTQPVPRSMAELATDYLTDMRKIQPTGPYCLAGYSWGGRLALEIAQQLVGQGERVSFLGMIDTMNDLQHAVPSEAAGARLKRHIGAVGKKDVGSYLADRIKKTAVHRATSLVKAVRNFPNEVRLRLRRPVPYRQRTDVYESVFASAARRQKLRPYPGPVTMFAGLGKSEFHRARWSPIAQGGLTIHEIPAGHHAMVWPPYSSMLAAAFDMSFGELD